MYWPTSATGVKAEHRRRKGNRGSSGGTATANGKLAQKADPDVVAEDECRPSAVSDQAESGMQMQESKNAPSDGLASALQGREWNVVEAVVEGPGSHLQGVRWDLIEPEDRAVSADEFGPDVAPAALADAALHLRLKRRVDTLVRPA